jgi:NAD(P)-dependent dehydrogenase (short-subunit alcohol dehydrogenase family)
MPSNATKSALVTGANSGLGFEAAAQLAELGYARVILATRTLAKGQAARAKLVERTGKDPFEELVVDVSNNGIVRAAVDTLTERGGKLDAVLLNAGLMSSTEIVRNEDGVEITVAASIIGHHVLTMGLLEHGLLTPQARIVLAGSEAARGDVPMMKLTDIQSFAADNTDGDRAKAIALIARAESPYVYKHMPHYAMTKLFLAWWVAALARRMPDGVTITAVSPGSVPSTGVSRNQGWLMQFMSTKVMGGWLGEAVGMGASVEKATKRYIDAFDYGTDVNGQFFASVPGKMVGKVVRQTQAHVLDEPSEEAAWRAVVSLSGAALPAAASQHAVM